MEPTVSGSELLTTGQVAKLLGVSRQHVVDLCERGELRFVRVGAHRRILRSDLDRLIGTTLTRDQERSLWLHRAVAGRLVLNPPGVLAKARANLDRLEQIHHGTMAGRYVRRWRQLIDGDLGSVLDMLTSRTEEAVELRQNSPFAGVLSEADRQACLAAFRTYGYHERAA